jgi:predicted peroxiredoxin
MKAAHAIVMAGVVALVLALTTGGAQSTQNTAQTRDGVVIHITHGKDSPQHVLMGLNMASMMSDDHDVLVYFDIKAIDVVLKDAPELKYSTAASSRAVVKALGDKGVPLIVCPGCLKAAGKIPDDLTPGIRIAEKDSFFSFTKGRILTLDY